MTTQKVFVIGFQKTGTTSLGDALTLLGYRVCGSLGVTDTNIALTARDLVFEHAERFDAFQDNPWPIYYRELDIRYPGSKFVLTLRPSGDWIRSLIRHFGDDSTPMREWIYGSGSPFGNEEEYMARFEQHNRDVLEYFADRTGDLLIMSLGEGDGWSQAHL